MKRWLQNISRLTEGFLASYAQVFFSDNLLLASMLLAVSFIDPEAGLAGAVAVITANTAARSMGYNSWFIRKGFYGYNSLLVGLGFGLTFQPGLAFYFLLVIASLLTFLFTVAIQGVFYKYRLPFLSVPFLLGIWLVMTASGEFAALGLSSRGVFVHNELFAIGGKWLIDGVEWFDNLIREPFLRTYLFSLGAIFFQYNLLAGVLIALGILVFSRISFTLSLLGFFLAWLFYKITGADISVLGYSYIGFNYILTSIAVGGFFLIPSRWSYLWLLWLLPMVILVTLSLQKLFSIFQLGLYALPFNLVVITFLYTLKVRLNPGHRLVETPVQQFSPEKNLYHNRTNAGRFFYPDYLPVDLPVVGEWTINQGYDGTMTHRGEWRHGLDLVMTGTDGKEFRGDGNSLRDYYCYEKPVIAPADGIIADMTDGIADNPVGESNLRQNWGNSIVIKHADMLYSQVSHLKPGSVKVKKGESVKKGDVIALCGNSGRSPYPHLHFQIQATPHIGSRTIHYPISNFLVNQGGARVLATHAIPAQDERITAISNHRLIEAAFHFLPGKKMVFNVTGSGKKWLDGRHEWEVKTDEYNNSYIECLKTGTTAWFYNNGSIHYFVNYVGTRKTLLYFFYLAFYKVLLGYYKDLKVDDLLPPDKVFNPLQLFFQDFVAPFKIYLKAEYRISCLEMEDDFFASSARLTTVIKTGRQSQIVIESQLSDDTVASFDVMINKFIFKAVCIESS